MPTKYIGYITQPEVYEVPAITLYYIILYFYKHYISISQSEQNFLIQFPRYAAVTKNPLEKKDRMKMEEQKYLLSTGWSTAWSRDLLAADKK